MSIPSTEELKRLIADLANGLPFSVGFTVDLAREVVRLRENNAELKDAFELWEDANKAIWHGFKSSKFEAAINAICKEP